MNKLLLLILAGPFTGLDIESFVVKWNDALLRSVLIQQSSVNTPKSVTSELREVSDVFSSEEYRSNLRKKESIKFSFISYVYREKIIPTKTGGIIVERPRSGEQSTITYYLLVENEHGYRATAFNYASGWELGKSNIVASSYVDSLLLKKYCYFQGYNDEPVSVTKFSKHGNIIFSQYFASSSICTSLGKLDAL